MVEPFVIKSAVGQRILEFHAHDGDYFIALVRASGLEAKAPVSSYLSTGFGEFFAELAREWKGWRGTKQWASLEGELVLRAESDRTGHIGLEVHLHDGAPARWTVETGFSLEAGQLDRIAAEARTFEVAAIHVA